MQYAGGELAHHDLIPVGFFQCCDENPGFHRTVIDKEGLEVTAGAAVGGLADVAGETVALPATFHLHHLAAFSAIDAVHRGFQLTGAGGGQHFLAVPNKAEGYFGMGQGLQLYCCGHLAAFHSIGFHKLHSCGRVKEQIPHDNGGAVGAACFRLLGDRASFQRKTGAGNGAGGLGQQVNAADGSNSSQSFTAETHGGNRRQVFCRAQLGGSMAQKGRTGILGTHTAAIVGDADKGHAAITDLHRDLGGTGIHGVFQQFFHHGGRPFHYLTGSY